MSALTEIIKQFSGQYNTITLQRPYIKFTGSPEGGLLLSQMIYWADRTKDPDGWFYKTYPEWEEEIGVKKKAVSKFASAWVRDGFLETDVRKNPQGTPVVHYRFSIDLFTEKLTDFLESANPPDRKFQDGVSNKSTRSKVLNDPIESSNPHDRKCQSARTTLYTSNTSSNTSSTNTSPERGREESHELFSSETIGLSIAEDFGGRSDFVVQQPKDSALAQDDRREDQIAAAPKISQDWNYSAMGPIDVVSVTAVVTTDEPCQASGYIDIPPNGFEGFRAVYEELCDNVDGRFGSVEVARESWRVAWRGLEPPEDFWTGLSLYCNQQKNEFLRTGKCWTLGAKRFLEDEKWRSALRIGARDQRAAAQGVDFHNPELLKKEALIASNRRNGELARLSLIEKGFLTA